MHVGVLLTAWGELRRRGMVLRTTSVPPGLVAGRRATAAPAPRSRGAPRGAPPAALPAAPSVAPAALLLRPRASAALPPQSAALPPRARRLSPAERCQNSLKAPRLLVDQIMFLRV